MKKLIPILFLLISTRIYSQIQPFENSQLDDSVKADVVYISDEIKDNYIVELNSSPVSTRQIDKQLIKKFKLNSKAYKSEKQRLVLEHLKKINKEQNEFLEDLGRIKKQNVNKKLHKQKILQNYKSALNGFAIEADSISIKEIRKMRNVKRIVKDRIVKVNNITSDSVIGAPQVWQKTGATGKKIRIGILDTGIDPDHPEFTGRVLRGYDFVDNDTIPYDEHGHGTHCAGIAAGNGPKLKGVAPDALIMPIRVLNKFGSGTWSNIIAGVNYAIDPDSNALTDDGVKVLSISLGGPGSPDDPLAHSINNAFERNVLCVVAAGNNGSDYYTVGSPGCAEFALTVGATDNDDVLANFSSRGPVKGSFQVKPEVVAPGVGIYSSIPDGYEVMSGTSMATPHVAGAAALLLELHPDWTAEYVKSALIQSCKDIGYNVWEQGYGRIDLEKAINTNLSVTPQIISFGNSINTDSVYNKTQKLKIRNLSNTTRSFNISLFDSLPEGISLSFPETISVNDSGSIDISLNLDTSKYHFPDTKPSFYNGKFLLSNVNDSIYVPFVVNKVYSATLIYDKIPDCIVVHNRIDQRNIYYPFDSIFTFCVDNAGEYDIISAFNGFNDYVVREKVFIDNKTKLNISYSEAKNELTLKGTDQYGDSLPVFYGNGDLFIHKNSGLGLILMRIIGWTNDYNVKHLKRRISDLSSDYRFDFENASYPGWNKEKREYLFPYEIADGINESREFNNSKEDFVHITRKFPSRFLQDSVYIIREDFSIGYFGSSGVVSNYEKPFYDEYLLPFPSKEYKFRSLFHYGLKKRIGDKPEIINDSLLFRTGNEVYLQKDTFSSGNTWADYHMYPVKNKEISLSYSTLPIHYMPNFYVDNSKVSLPGRSQVFLFSNNDVITGPISVTTDVAGGKDTTFKIFNDSYYTFGIYDNTYYQFPVDSTFKKIKLLYTIGNLDNYQITSTAIHYKTKVELYSPTNIRKFQFKENDSITDHLRKGHLNSVEFACTTNDSVYFFIKNLNDSIWQKINCSTNKKDISLYNIWTGKIPDSLKLGYYEIKIIAKSYYDSLIYTVSPAFVFYSDSCKNGDTKPNLTLSSSDDNNIACRNEKIKLTASGANFYYWSNNINSPEINVGETGKYSVIGKNLYGCTDSASVDVIIDSSIVDIKNSDSDGFICSKDTFSLTATGLGEYLWSTGDTNSIIYPNHSGVYRVKRKSFYGCETEDSVQITINQSPDIYITTNDSDNTICTNEYLYAYCHGANAYYWSDTIYGDFRYFNESGNYSIVGYGINGCTDTAYLYIKTNPVPEISINDKASDISICNYDTILLHANTSDSILWNTGDTSKIITGHPWQFYMVTATNQYNCQSSAWVYIKSKNSNSVYITSNDNNGVICKGDTIDYTAHGEGTFLWSTGETTAIKKADTTGYYTVTNIDTSGCITSSSINLSVSNPQVSITSTDEDNTICSGNSISLYAGGYDCFYFNWSNGTNGSYNFINQPGHYTVTGSDFYGCTDTASIDITVNPLPSLTINDGKTEIPICIYDTIVLHAYSSDPVIWSTGDSSEFITGRPYYSYSVTATNQYNCQSSTWVYIKPKNSNSVYITSNDNDGAICKGDTIEYTAHGEGTFLWSTGETIAIKKADTAGYYTVTNIDTSGCITSSSINLSVGNPQVSITSTDEDNTICSGNSISLYAGGYDCFYFNWSNGTNGSYNLVNQPGHYTVTGSDFYGCTDTASVDITVNPLPSLTINDGKTEIPICINDTIVLHAYSSDPVIWSTGDSSEFITGRPSYSYSVTATNQYYCQSSAWVYIKSKNSNSVYITSNDNDGAICKGDTIEYTAHGEGSFQWSTGAATAIIKADTSGTYTVINIDTSGCITSSSTYLFVGDPQVTIDPGDSNYGLCHNEALYLFASGSDVVNFNWSGGENTSYIYVSSPGKYTVEGHDDYGCSDTASVEIQFSSSNSKEIEICADEDYNGHTQTGIYFERYKNSCGCDSLTKTYLTVNELPDLNLGSDRIITNTQEISLTAGNFSSYQWYDNSTDETISFKKEPGLYTIWVIVTNDKGCKNSDTINITVLNDNNITNQEVTCINIYPNPVSKELYADLHVADYKYLEINDIYGKLVKKINIPYNSTFMNIYVSDFARGMYYINFIGNNIITTKSFIVK